MGWGGGVSIWARAAVAIAIVSAALLLIATPVAMLALLAAAIPVVALDTCHITPTPDEELR